MYYIHNLHAEYGPIVRIAPNEVAIADVEAFKTIHHHRTGYPKSSWYQALGGDASLCVLQLRDKMANAARRKLLSRGFSLTQLRADWEPEVLRLFRLAVSRLKQ